MKWTVLEWAEALRLEAVRAPFPVSKLVQVITCNFSTDMIHEMGVHRFRQKNKPSEISFSFQLNGDAQSLLYIVLLHGLNALGTLLANILQMDKRKRYNDVTTALRRTRMDPNLNATKIAYHTPASCVSILHQNVWHILSDAIFKLPNQCFLS